MNQAPNGTSVAITCGGMPVASPRKKRRSRALATSRPASGSATRTAGSRRSESSSRRIIRRNIPFSVTTDHLPDTTAGRL